MAQRRKNPLRIKIKWLRKRDEFLWQKIKISLDFTQGYGYILEMEKLCSPNEKEKDLFLLKGKFKELGIEITPRTEFERKFKDYQKNWRKLIAAD